MAILYPPIAEVADRTRQEAFMREAALSTGSVETEPNDNDAPIRMPNHIAAKIKNISAISSQTTHELKSGMIVLVDRRTNDQGQVEQYLPNPFAFCLDRQLTVFANGFERWSGWIAAPESDYASEKDMLLEVDDQPFDPLASMVQTWNPLNLIIVPGLRLLAQLSTDRLAAIQAIARETGNRGYTPQPGRVGLRTSGGYMVLTGTPLGAINDPRHKYQQLYRTLATSFLPVAANEPQKTPSKSRLLQGLRLRFALAASLMVAAGTALIVGNLQDTQHDEPLQMAKNEILAKEFPPVSPDKNSLEAKTDNTDDVPSSDVNEKPASPLEKEETKSDEVSHKVATPARGEMTDLAKPSPTTTRVPNYPVFTAMSRGENQANRVQSREEKIPLSPPAYLATVDEAYRTSHYARRLGFEEPLPEKRQWSHVLYVKEEALIPAVLQKLKDRKLIVSRVYARAPLIALSLPQGFRIDILEREIGAKESCLKREEWLAEQDVRKK